MYVKGRVEEQKTRKSRRKTDPGRREKGHDVCSGAGPCPLMINEINMYRSRQASCMHAYVSKY